MDLLLLIIIFTAIGGLLSVLAAAVFLLLPDAQQKTVLPHGISFATGALLAGSFCGLIPHAFENATHEQVESLSATILAGILLFFILEKLLLWRHCHAHGCEVHDDGEHIHYHDDAHSHSHHHGRRSTTAMLIIFGDSLHNFVDGVLIAAAFLTDAKLGIVTSLAVAAHEIPQEVGDFAILLHNGYSKFKALVYNMLASLGTVLGGILAYFGLDNVQEFLPYLLALAASSFIYIAVADLIPSLHKKTDTRTSLQQIALILAGVLLIVVLQEWAHGVMGE